MTTAAELRDEGIQLSLMAQEERSPEWGKIAREHLIWVAQRWPTFTSEDVRSEAERRGLATPKEPRAWGAIFQRAVKAELIERVGYRESFNPQAHTRPVAVWKATAKAWES